MRPLSQTANIESDGCPVPGVERYPRPSRWNAKAPARGRSTWRDPRPGRPRCQRQRPGCRRCSERPGRRRRIPARSEGCAARGGVPDAYRGFFASSMPPCDPHEQWPVRGCWLAIARVRQGPGVASRSEHPDRGPRARADCHWPRPVSVPIQRTRESPSRPRSRSSGRSSARPAHSESICLQLRLDDLIAPSVAIAIREASGAIASAVTPPVEPPGTDDRVPGSAWWSRWWAFEAACRVSQTITPNL